MAWMPRLFSVLFLVPSVLLATDISDITNSPQAPTAASFTALAQIVVDEEAKSWTSDVQIDSYVYVLVRLVGGEHDWTVKDPLWSEVTARVRTDVVQHLDQFLRDRREAAVDGYARSYQLGLSPGQAKDIARLYLSEHGQKYLAFSADVFNLYLDVMIRARNEGDHGPLREAMANALRQPLSTDQRFLLAAGTRYLVSGGGGIRTSPTGLTKQRMAIAMVAGAAPAEWNALFSRYASDMAGIVEVANDPLTIMEMERSQSYGPDESKIAHFRSAMASWKAFYWEARAKQLQSAATP
jgi:hypothetical protein